MKEIAAILFFLFITLLVLSWIYKKEIPPVLAVFLLFFGLCAGFVIVNYDVITHFRYKDLELEIREIAVKEVQGELENQKESIQLLIRNVNETSEKLNKQSSSLKAAISAAYTTAEKMEALSDELNLAKKDIGEQRNAISELVDKVTRIRDDIDNMYNSIKELSLAIAKMTYLEASTKSEFGTERAIAAQKGIETEINKLVSLVLPNSREKAAWIRDVQTTLPSRK